MRGALSLLFAGCWIPPVLGAPKLLWISLDGLRGQWIQEWLSGETGHPSGFASLFQRGVVRTLMVPSPANTAPSHATILTGLPAAGHGVYGNAQWNGSNMVSGFGAQIHAATFPEVLQQHGYRVASLSFPGVHPAQVSLSTEFPDAYALPYRTVRAAEGDTISLWDQGPRARVSLKGGLALESSGCKTASSGPRIVRLVCGQTTLVVKLTGEPGSLRISPPGTIEAGPPGFRDRLTSLGLIPFFGRDFGLKDADREGFFLELEEKTRVFGRVLREAVQSSWNLDAVFAYFEELDLLGHLYEGDPAATPLRFRHLKVLDNALGEVLSDLPPSTQVVLLGDHGISQTQVRIDVRMVTGFPKDLTLDASGGTLLAWGKGDRAAPWVRALASSLRDARIPWLPAERLFSQVDVPGGGGAGVQPWVLAYTEPGITLGQGLGRSWVLERRPTYNPLGFEAFVSKDTTPLTLLGSHGHRASHPAMATTLVLAGDRLRPRGETLGPWSSLDVASFVATRLGVPFPRSAPKRAAP